MEQIIDPNPRNYSQHPYKGIAQKIEFWAVQGAQEGFWAALGRNLFRI